MINSEMREEFEAAEHSRAAEAGRTWEPHAFKRSSSTGDYLNPLIAHGWWAWQASRESLVIKLPKGDSLARRMYGPQACGANPLISRFDAIEAIEAAGPKVAP